GVVLSIVSILLGLTIPLKLLFIVALATIILTVIGNARLLSAAFTIGIPLLLLSSFSLFSFEWNFLGPMDSNDLIGASVMLGLLMVAEGLIMLKNGLKDDSPKLRTSRRELTVGALPTKRFWLLTSFLFLPSGVLTMPIVWWPV